MTPILFPGLIDIAKWDAARWVATAFLHDPEGTSPPCLGLVFQNIHVGRAIFEAWLERLGTTDRYEELRIAIIEGDILGEAPGYSVHVSSDPLNTERRLKAGGKSVEWDQAILMTRFNRMSPPPDSPHLRQFKIDLQKHKRYSLIPVSTSKEPLLDCAIEKTEIHFRTVSELTKSDFDAVVLPANSFDSQSIN